MRLALFDDTLLKYLFFQRPHGTDLLLQKCILNGPSCKRRQALEQSTCRDHEGNVASLLLHKPIRPQILNPTRFSGKRLVLRPLQISVLGLGFEGLGFLCWDLGLRLHSSSRLATGASQGRRRP